jgi:rhodanese-related sulfurtransferase
LSQPNVLVVDVRNREEFAQGSVHGALNLPVQQLSKRLLDLPEDVGTPIVVFCAAGKRAMLAKGFLEQVGYVNVLNGERRAMWTALQAGSVGRQPSDRAGPHGAAMPTCQI